MTKFIVAYVTENEDLYHEIFPTLKAAEDFIGEGGRAENCKAIIFEVAGSESEYDIIVRDHT